MLKTLYINKYYFAYTLYYFYMLNSEYVYMYLLNKVKA